MIVGRGPQAGGDPPWYPPQMERGLGEFLQPPERRPTDASQIAPFHSTPLHSTPPKSTPLHSPPMTPVPVQAVTFAIVLFLLLRILRLCGTLGPQRYQAAVKSPGNHHGRTGI